MSISAIPISFRDACRFVQEWHRHHKPPQGHKFSIGAISDDELIGVVIVGRPVSRHRDDGLTAEVTRLCTNGHRNACSFLYGAAARAAFAMGYQRIGTYTLQSEPGTSLVAAGWQKIGVSPGRSWNFDCRPRAGSRDLQPRFLFERVAA